MKFFCVADEDTVRGFRLAGIDGVPVASPEDFRQALTAAVADPEVGTVLWNACPGDTAQPLIDALRIARACPLFVEVPSPCHPRLPGSATDPMIRGALGIGMEIDPETPAKH